jgi:hypothetical protein
MAQTVVPVILLTSTCWWPSVARLALSLAEAGCIVSAVCPARGHPLKAVSAVHQLFHYSPTDPLGALSDAISAAQPDIIVPCDDRAVLHLHQLHARHSSPSGRNGTPLHDLARLIERSLGDPSGFATVRARYPLLSMARAAGVRIPETAELNSADDVDGWLSRHGLPCVLKVDGSWGGNGVRVAECSSEAHQAFDGLARPCPSWIALKRYIIDRDPYWLAESRRRVTGAVSVQEHISGRPANCAVFCWEGRVLAGIAVEVLQTQQPGRPATIVQVVDRPEMLQSAHVLARCLKMSGFFGLDFMIDSATDVAQLIELNARPTPLCHLRLGPGRDLVGALTSTLSGRPILASRVTDAEVIAYFPSASQVNAAEIPEGAYHDVPLGAPALVKELLRRPWQERSFLARSFYWGVDIVTKWSKRRPEQQAGKAPSVVKVLKQRGTPTMVNFEAD